MDIYGYINKIMLNLNDKAKYSAISPSILALFGSG